MQEEENKMNIQALYEIIADIVLLATCRYLQKQLKLYPRQGIYHVKDTVLSIDIKGHVQLNFKTKHDGIMEIYLDEPVQLKCRENQFSIHPNTPTNIQYSLSKETLQNMKEENVQLKQISHCPDNDHVVLHLVYDKIVPIPLKIKAKQLK